jgi:hypothetical protein
MKRNLTAILLIYTATIASAQSKLNSPMLGFTMQATPIRNLKEKVGVSQVADSITGQYGFQTYTVQGLIPIYKKYKDKGQALPAFTSISLQGSVGFQQMTLTWLNNKQNIYRGSLGLIGFHYNGFKSLYMGSIQAFMANDNYTIAHPFIRPSAYFVYNRMTRKNYSYKVGLAYTYNFGRALFLPVLGIRFKTSSHATLAINFPSGISYAYKTTKAKHSFYLRQRGNVATLTNQFGEFNTRADQVRLRSSERQLGWGMRRTLNSHFILTTDIGFGVRRKLLVSDQADHSSPINFKVADVANNLYIQAGFLYRFKKKTEKRADDSIPLSDTELQDIDVSDLE